MDQFKIGDSFNVHFVWRLPDDDYLRALFEVTIIAVDADAEKFIAHLDKFVAGRQETPNGEPRAKSEFSLDYWRMVDKLAGQKVQLAYESQDGRPLHMRLTTLTGEHKFFSRFSENPAAPDKE